MSEHFLELLEDGGGCKADHLHFRFILENQFAQRRIGAANMVCGWISPAAPGPVSYGPGQGWTFWQYSYQARLPGISTNLGFNWFNGSITELKQMVIQ